MAPTTDEAKKLEALRRRAHERLTGEARPGVERMGAAAALGVLHELASSPVSAADALAVLHELQVHQVELALQDEDLQASVAELEAALTRQLQREEFAPVALFGVDQRLALVEGNLAGMQLLRCTREAALGRPFVDYFQADDGPRLRALFALRDARRPRDPVRARLLAVDGHACDVQVSAAADPSLPQRFRVAVMAIAAHAT